MLFVVFCSILYVGCLGFFHPAFEVDLIEATRHLEQQQNDFGRQFLGEIERPSKALCARLRLGDRGTGTSGVLS